MSAHSRITWYYPREADIRLKTSFTLPEKESVNRVTIIYLTISMNDKYESKHLKAVLATM
jgi:hypothetical protein